MTPPLLATPTSPASPYYDGKAEDRDSSMTQLDVYEVMAWKQVLVHDPARKSHNPKISLSNVTRSEADWERNLLVPRQAVYMQGMMGRVDE